MCISHDPAVPILDMYWAETCSYVYQKKSIRLFIAAPLIITPTWEKFKCASAVEQTSNGWCIHTTAHSGTGMHRRLHHAPTWRPSHTSYYWVTEARHRKTECTVPFVPSSKKQTKLPSCWKSGWWLPSVRVNRTGRAGRSRKAETSDSWSGGCYRGVLAFGGILQAAQSWLYTPPCVCHTSISLP